MASKTILYFCIGCTIVSCITCLIFALIGCWPGAINSPFTTVCLWGIYYLLGKLDDRTQSSREMMDLCKSILSDNGKLAEQVRVLQTIIEVKDKKEQTEQAE